VVDCGAVVCAEVSTTAAYVVGVAIASLFFVSVSDISR